MSIYSVRKAKRIILKVRKVGSLVVSLVALLVPLGGEGLGAHRAGERLDVVVKSHVDLQA